MYSYIPLTHLISTVMFQRGGFYPNFRNVEGGETKKDSKKQSCFPRLVTYWLSGNLPSEYLAPTPELMD